MPSSGVKTCALRSEEHTSELQSNDNLVCRLLLEKKKKSERDGSTRADTTRPCTHCDYAATLRPARALSPMTPLISCPPALPVICFFFFFNDTATTEIYTLSLHDALPIHTSELQSHDNLYAVFWSSDV